MKNTRSVLIFFLGLFCFSLFRIGYTLSPLTLRDEPIELDDAYTYAWKAVNFDNCFFSDCPAQNDLWQQYFAPTDDESLAKARRRGATFTFHRYTFLHEAILSFVKSFGLSWADSLNLVAVVGICCIVMSLAYWLFQLWGPLVAGFSLFAVGPLMKWQDFQLIVPFVLTLAIAGFLWGIILRSLSLGLIALPIGSLLLVLMHPLGRIYSLIAVGLIIVRSDLKKTVSTFLGVGLSLLIVASAFVVPRFVSRPLINEWDLPHVADYQWWPHFVATLVSVFGRPGSVSFLLSVVEWATLISGFVLSVIFSRGDHRRFIIAFGVMLLGLTFLSLLYVWPGYPGLLFGRIWTPVGLFFYAAGGFVIFQIPKLKAKGKSRQLLLLQGFAALLLAQVAYQWIDQVPKFFASVESRTLKHNFVLDVDQTSILSREAKANARILYLDEVPMIFHLNYGAHRYGAVFLPVVTQSEIESQWITGIDFVVGFNKPLQDLASPQRYPEGIYLDQILNFEIQTSKGFSLSDVQLLIAGLDKSQQCEIRWAADMPAGNAILSGAQWQKLSNSDDGSFTRYLRISISEECHSARLVGVKLSSEQETNWPWEKQAKFVLNTAIGEQKTGYFDLDKLLQDKRLEKYSNNELSNLRVLADSGSLILLKK